MKLRFSFVIAVLLCLGCGGEPPPECQFDDGTWPRCNADGSMSECRRTGTIHESTCDDGETCIEPTSGDRWVACVPTTAELCEPSDWTPVCADSGALILCDGRIAMEGASYTEHTDCGENICFSTTMGAGCLPPHTTSCDPATFGMGCAADTVVSCDPEGYTIVEDDCVDQELACVERDGVPWCADADAAPCDLAELEVPTCIDGHVRICNEESLLTTKSIECEADEVCRVDNCFATDLQECDETSQPQICSADGTQEQLCNSLYGVYLTRDCADGSSCVDANGWAQCVTAEAQPCDLATFEPSCVDAGRQLGCSVVGFTEETRCNLGDVCRTSQFGSYCVASDSVPCDPVTYQAACISGDAVSCDPLTFSTKTNECENFEICVVDDLAGVTYAECISPNLSACVEPAHLSCDMQTLEWCFGGYIRSIDCEAIDRLCVSDGVIGQCIPDDSASCDPLNYQQRCEEGSLITCLSGKVTSILCDNYGRVCDVDQGCIIN